MVSKSSNDENNENNVNRAKIWTLYGFFKMLTITIEFINGETPREIA